MVVVGRDVRLREGSLYVFERAPDSRVQHRLGKDSCIHPWIVVSVFHDVDFYFFDFLCFLQHCSHQFGLEPSQSMAVVIPHLDPCVGGISIGESGGIDVRMPQIGFLGVLRGAFGPV